jgi:peptidoglycan-associated lipoprotein
MRNAASFLVAAGAVVLAFGLTACPKKKPKDPTCDSDEDCKDGLKCIDKTCQEPEEKPECVQDTDCPDGKVCKAGACAACASDAECGPGGRCTSGACERAKACSVDEDCEDDEDCVDGFCQKPWAGGGGEGDCQLQTVYFAFDDSTIAQSERDRLEANAACVEKTTGQNVYVFGHTDQTGTDEYNIALSERRARATADFMAALGIDPARLDIVGKGETELTGQGDDQDRRVEFQFH